MKGFLFFKDNNYYWLKIILIFVNTLSIVKRKKNFLKLKKYIGIIFYVRIIMNTLYRI